MLSCLRACAAALCLSVLVALGAAPADARGRAPEPDPSSGATRIMLYGDSITHGSTGDWTWRFRLAQALTAAGTPFDFVGPRDDLMAYWGWIPGSRHYRAAFDTDHASLGGMRFTDASMLPGRLTATYRPDVFVGLIGYNDLRHGVSPAVLERTWLVEIGRMRAANPWISVLLVPVPETWVPGVTDYNSRLADLADRLDTPQSRVVLAPSADWSVFRDTYDYAHPSAAGERRLAVSVADALAGLGVPADATAFPDPASEEPWAPEPTATATGTSVTVSWPRVDYASSQHVYVRDVTRGTTAGFGFVLGTSKTFAGVPGHAYEIWLRPVKGYLPLGTRSSTTSVTVPLS